MAARRDGVLAGLLPVEETLIVKKRQVALELFKTEVAAVHDGGLVDRAVAANGEYLGDDLNRGTTVANQ